ncbi:MAG: hypothetical protein C5B51_07855 [Terriglobia bacterium]|nr:MAG: hypothetical protein C5B51_07855 [Terriglobia bacterium]
MATKKGRSARKASGRKAGTQTPQPATREGTKKAKILALLQRPQSATLGELMKATGWQQHSLRGFLSGALRKKMGLKLKSGLRADGVRVYKVRA